MNVPVSDPLPFTSFFGSRPSFAGDVNVDGKLHEKSMLVMEKENPLRIESVELTVMGRNF